MASDEEDEDVGRAAKRGGPAAGGTVEDVGTPACIYFIFNLNFKIYAHGHTNIGAITSRSPSTPHTSGHVTHTPRAQQRVLRMRLLYPSAPLQYTVVVSLSAWKNEHSHQLCALSA